MTITGATTAHRDTLVVPRRPARQADVLDDRWLLLAAGAISGGIVAGMYVGSGLLMTSAAVAALVAGVFYPPLGLLVVAFMGPLRPPSVIPAPGFNMLLVGAILLGCVYRLPLSRNRLLVSPPLLLLMAFVLYVFFQQLPEMASGYSGTEAHDTGFLFFQLLTGLGTIVAAGFILRGRSPMPFFVALLISATFSAILGILTAGSSSYPQLQNILAISDVADRATGPFSNPNAYGQFLAYGVALAAGWIASTRSARVRTGLLVAVAIMAYAISLSLSRGAVAALLAGLVALAFARGRKVGFAAAAVALVLVIVGYPLFVTNRLTTELGSASSAAVQELNQSDLGRLDAVLAGPELFATSPIFGIGFGQYKYSSALVTDQGGGLVAHNWYGTVLAEQGLLGIVLWLLMLVTVATWLRSRPARPRLFGFAMLGATVVGCLFLQPPTSFQMSVMPILVMTGVLVGDLGGRIAATGVDGPGILPSSGHRPDSVRRQAEVADLPTDA